MNDNVKPEATNVLPEAINTLPEETTVLAPEASIATTPENPDFLSSVSEEFRGDPSLKDFKHVDGLAKSYIESQKMIGSSIRIPSSEASEEVQKEFHNKLDALPGVLKIPSPDDQEGIAKFYNKLGRPEKADGYDFIFEDKAINDVVAGSPEMGKEFGEMAHNLGLSKTQAKTLVEFEANKIKNYNEQLLNSREQSMVSLKKEWGNDYDARLHGAKAVAKLYADQYPEAMNELLNGPAGNNPAFIKMLSELGGTLQETGHKGMEQSVKYGMSREDALNMISDIRDNPKSPIYDSLHPDKDKQQQKLEELYDIANSS